MKNKFLFLLFLFILYILFNYFFYANNISKDIEQSVFRLHVIANSDSKEDQNLKYKVRDNIINYLNTLCSNSPSKEKTIQIANNNLTTIQKIANNTIQENGFNYSATVEIGNFEFPTKNYGDISIPSGYYDALKVKLGKSTGQNWWCVLYPSLCFIEPEKGIVSDSSKEELKATLSEEEFALLSYDTPTYKIKFKLIEIFNNNFKLGKK